MRIFTLEDIQAWDPCYNPERFLPPGWRGTVIDILDMKHVPFHERVWCVSQGNLLSNRLLRSFGIACVSANHAFFKDEECEHILWTLAEYNQEDPSSELMRELLRDSATRIAWESHHLGNATRHATWALAWACSHTPAKASAWAAAAFSEKERTAAVHAQEEKLRQLIQDELV